MVGALPGFMGHETMKRVIMAKRNIVDISFYPEDPFTLDKLAKENNVVAVMDCGQPNHVWTAREGRVDPYAVKDTKCQARQGSKQQVAVVAPQSIVRNATGPRRKGEQELDA